MKALDKLLVTACFLFVVAAATAVSYTTVTGQHIVGSLLDSTPIGTVTPAAGTFTSVTSTGGDIVAQGAGALRAGPAGIVTAGSPGFFTSGPYVGGTGQFSGNVAAASFIGALAGNASTASALQTTPSNCGAYGFSYGIGANGNALCGNASGNFSSAGYQYLPNGLILQWTKGYSAVNGRGQLNVALPLTFPHGCITAQVTVEFQNYVSSANYQGAAFYLEPNGCATSSVSMQYDVRSDGTADSAYYPRILAIGY